MADQRERSDADTGDDEAAPDGAPVEQPEFGPGGYLPDRASRRARKIILRAPLGLQWVIGALVVGVVVAVAGWFALRDTAPAAPYLPVPAEAVEADGGVALWDPATTDDTALVVTSGNRSRVFAWAGDEPPVLCAESGLLEAADGRAWRLTGRGLGGAESLAEHPLIIDGGTVYADPTTTLEPLAPDPDAASTACR